MTFEAPAMGAAPATVAGLSAPARVAVLPAGVDALEDAHPREVVRWAIEAFPRGRVAVVTGLQADGMAVTDMALDLDPLARIVTVDTGRLPAATYAYIDSVRRQYGRSIEVVFPERRSVEALVAEHGVDAFRISVERRLDCCHVRKVEPLERVLATVDCWLTGLRRGHSRRREATPVVEVDHAHAGIVKVNPVARWSESEVAAYLAERGVPAHPLYAVGYRSIGCDPCTRPVDPGEDPRAGRWWWETGVEKECGIHGAPRASAG